MVPFLISSGMPSLSKSTAVVEPGLTRKKGIAAAGMREKIVVPGASVAAQDGRHAVFLVIEPFGNHAPLDRVKIDGAGNRERLIRSQCVEQ